MSVGPIKRDITDGMLDDAYEVWVDEISSEYRKIRAEKGICNMDELIKKFIQERGVKTLKKALKDRR
jgi:hypothetical protein